MHSSPPPPTSPTSFPLIGISALILIYVLISYLIIDFIDRNESSNHTSSDTGHCSSGLTLQDAQAMIPVFDYEASTNKECAICLDYMEKGERCKSLPLCKHTFHAQCIDLWLVRRRTCPTCRSPFKIIWKSEVV